MSLAHDIADYEAATTHFLDAADHVTAQNIDHHVEGGWSARQVIHHVADSEAQSYARLRRLLAEPAGSTILGYDEAAWAECVALGYVELPTGPFDAPRSTCWDGSARMTSCATASTPSRVATRSPCGSTSTANTRARTPPNCSRRSAPSYLRWAIGT
jgi:hypothetical protein